MCANSAVPHARKTQSSSSGTEAEDKWWCCRALCMPRNEDMRTRIHHRLCHRRRMPESAAKGAADKFRVPDAARCCLATLLRSTIRPEPSVTCPSAANRKRATFPPVRACQALAAAVLLTMAHINCYQAVYILSCSSQAAEADGCLPVLARVQLSERPLSRGLLFAGQNTSGILNVKITSKHHGAVMKPCVGMAKCPEVVARCIHHAHLLTT